MNTQAYSLNTLPVPVQLEIDRICTQFEAAWKTGSQPDLEEYCDVMDGCARAVLLSELLRVEFYYRHLHGDVPSVVEYASRFAPQSDLVAEVWEAFRHDAEWGTQSALAASQPTAPAVGRQLEPPLPQVAGYDVRRCLGRGGMASVYLAKDEQLGRLVALKLIAAAEPSWEHVARFVAEAQAVASLRHPQIVQIYEIGEHFHRPYLALEYVNGGSLAERLAGQPQPADRAARWLESMARAVQFAHEHGIVHRDLKPANILLEQTDPDESAVDPLDGLQPKVADFGLAKCLDTEGQATLTGVVVGTPSYMPPEQASAEHELVGPASDIYALGAILYELLTGRPPFKAATLVETALLVRTAQPVSPRQLQPHTPRDLETICLKCLRKEPLERYPSARALAEDLQRFRTGRPVQARPLGPLARFWRWSLRNRTIAALATAAVLLLVVGTVVAAYFAIESNRRAAANLQLAESNRQLAERQQAAKEMAEKEQQQTRAVLDYLVEAFRSPDPERDGREITIAEVLDQAAAQIGADPDVEPVTQAELLEAIGRSYLGLGLPTQAVSSLERSTELMDEHLGHDDQRTLSAHSHLARAYHKLGLYDEALHLARSNLAQRQQSLGAEHPDTLESMRNLGMISLSAGRTTEAIGLLEEALRAARDQFGPTDQRTLSTMTNLAWVYNLANRLEDAVALNEQALDDMRATLGDDNPHTLATMNNLATAYLQMNRTAESIQLLERVRGWAEKYLGADHPHTLTTMLNLARAHHTAGDLHRAVPLAERTWQLAGDTLGADHPRTLNAMAVVAVTQHAAGQLATALPLYQQVLERRRAVLGHEHPQTRMSEVGLAKALRDDGQTLAALELLRPWLEVSPSKSPTDRLDTDARVTLGSILVALERFDEAERLLTAAYATLPPEPTQRPMRDQQAADSIARALVDLYSAWDKPKEAAAWRGVQDRE